MRRSKVRVVRTAVALLAVAGLSLEACDADLDDLDSALEESGVTEDVDTEPEPEEPEETEEVEEAETGEADEPDETDELEPEAQDASAEVTAAEVCGDPATDRGLDPAPEGQLPGEDSPLYFSEEGEWVAVVGVEHTDVLCVRELPDPTSGWVAHIPSFDEALLTGRERLVGSEDSPSRWVEVNVVTGYGWVNANFLAHAGGDGQDVTADFTGYGPHADIDALIDEVADGHGQQWPGVSPIVTRHLGGASGDAGPGGPLFYHLDFIGARDDSLRGERLKFDVEQNADGYYVSLARIVPLCDRGATDDGLCL